MTAVGEAAGKQMIVEILGDALADANASQLHITAGNALGKADEIRHYAKMLERKHFSRSAKACHHFVADHHNAEFIAD